MFQLAYIRCRPVLNHRQQAEREGELVTGVFYEQTPAFMLQSTRTKIRIAKVLSAWAVLLFGRYKTVVRKGIRFHLDLTEGIDLSVFLFSDFQKHVYSRIGTGRPVHTVLDVGGNVGFMSLTFAKMFPGAEIFAFEPTHYAINKFRKNLELNPDLADRITITQAFVAGEDSNESAMTAYSSWKLDAREENGRHYVHSGIAKSTEGVGQLTLDSFVRERNLTPDLIKIDTDGYEHRVLAGMTNILAVSKPLVVFEVGQYVMRDHGITFDYYFDLFKRFDYRLTDTKTGKEVTLGNHTGLIPAMGTTDLLAVPN